MIVWLTVNARIVSCVFVALERGALHNLCKLCKDLCITSVGYFPQPFLLSS